MLDSGRKSTCRLPRNLSTCGGKIVPKVKKKFKKAQAKEKSKGRPIFLYCEEAMFKRYFRSMAYGAIPRNPNAIQYQDATHLVPSATTRMMMLIAEKSHPQQTWNANPW